MATVTSLGFSIFTTYKGSGAKKAASSLEKVKQAAVDTGKMATAALGAASVAVAALGAQTMKAGIESNALQQRAGMALETMLGSAEAAAEQMAALREFGSQSPISLSVWTKAQQQMLAFGVETSKVIPMLGAVQDAVAAAGGTEEEISGVVRALSQMASKGKLSAEELNQIGERGIDAAGVVAQAFGTTAADIREQITAGTLTVEEFFDGFVKGSEMAFGGAAEGLRQTFTGTIDRLMGAQRRIGEIFATPLVDPDGGGALVELGNAVADMLNNFEDAARPLGRELANEIAPAVERASATIRKFGESLNTADIREFISTVREAAPVIAAFAAGGIAKMAAGFTSALPGMAAFAGAINPVVVGATALAIAFPEVRGALFDLMGAVAPLVPPVAALASELVELVSSGAELAVSILSVVTPALSGLVSAITPVIQFASGLAQVISAIPGPVLATAAAVAGLVKVLVMMKSLSGALTIGGALVGAFDRVESSAKRAATAVGGFRNLLTGLAAGAIVAGVVALANAFSDSADELERVQSVTSSGVVEDLEYLVKTGRSSGGLAQMFGEGADAADRFSRSLEIATADASSWSNWWNVSGNEREAATTSIQTLDAAMAQAVQTGMDADEVMQAVAEAYSVSDDEMSQLLGKLPQYTAEAERQAHATDEAAAATREAHNEQAQLAAETSLATAALIEQSEQMRAQNDPLFALVLAQQELEAAQKDVNDAIAKYGADSDEATAASLEAASALMNYTAAGSEAADVLGNNLSPEFLAAAAAAGFTDEVVGLLTGEVENATDAFIDFADDYEATVRASGVDSVINAADRMKERLDAIDRTVRISFQYDNFRPWGSTKIPTNATGGPIIGPGTGTSDDILSYLSNGEFVVTAARVKAIGGFAATENLLSEAAGQSRSGGDSGPVKPVQTVRPVRVPVGSGRSSGNTFVFNGPVTSERQAEEMVLKAMRNLNRKGRLNG